MAEPHYVPLKDYDFGYTAKVPLEWNPTVYCLIAALSALPMWMTVELTFQIYATFKKYTGLYFWSLLICTWSITIRQIGRICIYFVPGCNQVFSLVFAMLGWVGTVSGFAVVLYSRLNLVTQDRRILRGVLIMIIFNVFALHMPTMIAQIGVVTKHHPSWISWYPIMEKIQITGFTIQETIISTIYIWAARRMIKESFNVTTKNAIRSLIMVQVLCISLDLPFIALAFANVFLVKATLTSFAYAIKLKLEFIVLNQLIGIVKNGIAPRSIHHSPPDVERATGSQIRRPSEAASATPRRHFSLSPFSRHRVIAPPPPAMKTGHIEFDEPVEENYSPPVSQAQTRMNSTALTNFAGSTTTDSGAVDKIQPHQGGDAVRPHIGREASFSRTERQYLGLYWNNAAQTTYGGESFGLGTG